MDPAVAVLLKLAPLAAAQLRAWRRGNLARNLDRLIRAELDSDQAIGPAVRESLYTQWEYIHGDSRGAVLIARLLGTGDILYLQALEIRSQEILAGLEELPLGVEATVKRVVALVSNNFIAAQKDEVSATQRNASAVLSRVDALATQEQLAALESKMERLLTRPADRVLVLPVTLNGGQQHHLTILRDKDPPAAARLGEILDNEGVVGLVEVVTTPPNWTVDLGAAFWEAVGAILGEGGPLAAAEQAYVAMAAAADAADPVDVLITAARCAEADGRPSDADAHLVAAKREDGEHPMVKLFEASRLVQAEQRLALTDDVETTTDRQLARKEAQRTAALLELTRFREARAAAEASLDANQHGAGQELVALVTIIEARQAPDRRRRDDRPLLEAVAFHDALRATMIEAGRSGMAALSGARAALGAAILGDASATAEAIESTLAIEGGLDQEAVRDFLIDAALLVADVEHAKALLPPEDGSPESRLQHATVAVMGGDDIDEAVSALDELLVELPPGGLRTEAALMRLMAAHDPDVQLDPALADELGEEGGLALVRTRTERAIATGDLGTARRLLADRDDAVSLGRRSEIAAMEGKLPEAVRLQETLTRKRRTSQHMMRLARLRAEAGDHLGAIREALRLAGDERKLPVVREAAYRVAAQAATDGAEYEELEDVADRWGALLPGDPEPQWAEAFALARQGRYEDAFEFVEERGLQPITGGNIHLLLGEIYLHGIIDPERRMRSLMELSDRFERPEQLERMFIGGVLTAPSGQRPRDDELIARFQDALSTFDDRFPDATGFVKLKVSEDEDPTELIRKMAELQGRETQEQVDARQEAIDGVRRATFPIAFFAAIVGRGTAETIIRNGAHPLGISDRDTHTAEVDAARAALDGAAASWEETAFITLGQLPGTYPQRLRAALAASVVGRTVRQSLDEVVATQMGGKQVATMHVLPDGTPQIFEENPETIERIRRIERAAAELAADVQVETDHNLGDDPLAQQLAAGKMRTSGAAAVSAMLLARERDLPLYSDDRALRAFARGFGIATFGTVALVVAAIERGILTREESVELRDAILDLGVWGLAIDPGLYVALARRMDFDLGFCLRPLLADEALLRVDPRIAHNALLLMTIADEAPEKLQAWAMAILDSYQLIIEADPVVMGSLILGEVLNPEAVDVPDAARARASVIIDAIRVVPGMGPPGTETDPLVGAVRRWLLAVEEAHQGLTLQRLLSCVREDDASMLRDVFEDSSEDGGDGLPAEPPAS